MDPLNPYDLTAFRPTTGTLEAWNEAYVRVEDYLRAHRLHNRLHQSRLIQLVLAKAARRHEQDPAAVPATLAAQEMDALMDRWFEQVLGPTALPKDRVAIAGRVALLLSEGAERWPYSFGDLNHIPEDFATAMRRSSVVAGPNMNVSSMVPREIDLGVISEAAGETLETMEKWPLLRMLMLWLVFIGALAVIFYASR